MSKKNKAEKKVKAAKLLVVPAVQAPVVQVNIGKPVDWKGTSRDDISAFPGDVKEKLGLSLYELQRGLTPTKASIKSFSSVGPGTYELITQDPAGWYRVLYVGKFKEAVYVLHCFTKTTNATSQPDVDLAKDRYKQLIAERKKAKK